MAKKASSAKTIKVTSIASGKVFHPTVEEAEIMKANPLLKKKYKYDDVVADPPEISGDNSQLVEDKKD